MLLGGLISVADGTATVTGQGSTAGTDSNIGVYVLNASGTKGIRATGAGSVNVTGTGRRHHDGQ